MDKGCIGIKEAAKALDVSPATIRRRIKKGELKAELVEGPNGPQWIINRNDLAESQEVKEVIPVTYALTPEALEQIIRTTVREETEPLRQELHQLKEQFRFLPEGKQEKPKWFEFWK